MDHLEDTFYRDLLTTISNPLGTKMVHLYQSHSFFVVPLVLSFHSTIPFKFDARKAQANFRQIR